MEVGIRKSTPDSPFWTDLHPTSPELAELVPRASVQIKRNKKIFGKIQSSNRMVSFPASANQNPRE